jgi:hypothetical protein
MVIPLGFTTRGELEIWPIRSMYVSSTVKNVLTSPIQSSALLAVPPGGELLNTSYMSFHTEGQLDTVLDVFKRTGKQMGVI